MSGEGVSMIKLYFKKGLQFFFKELNAPDLVHLNLTNATNILLPNELHCRMLSAIFFQDDAQYTLYFSYAH